MPYRAFPNACSPGEAGQALTPASQLGSQTRDNDSYAWTGHAETDRSYTVNGLNQYTTAGTATFTYDANGNLTADGTTTYVYDAENRLVSATAGGVTATLTWDPMGRLWQLVKGSANTRFLYDGDALVVEYASTGAVTNRYVHGSNAAADDPLVWYQGAGITGEKWLHADHLGSIVAISSTTGGSPTINSYDEYGIPAAANIGRFQYTGQAWLAELGLYHYKARFYSPTLGRFLQTDPIGYYDQINLYTYVANDPVNATDPDGLQSDELMDRRNQAFLSAGKECEGQGGACASAVVQGIGVAVTAASILVPIEGAIIKGLPWAGRALGLSKFTRFGRAASAFPKQLGISTRMPTAQLRTSMRSFEKNVAEHKEYLADPTKKVPDFFQRSAEYQKGLLNKWKEDVRRNEAYRDIAKGVLDQRRNCTGTRIC